MDSEELVIDGLNEDTEYTLNMTYDYIEEGQKTQDKYEMKVKTKAFPMPESGLIVSQIDKETITITKSPSDYSSWIKDVYVHVSGNSYYMGDATEFKVENLISDTTYNVYFTYKVEEPSTGNIYNGQDEEVRVRTLSVLLPSIVKFSIVEATQNTIKIEYQYIDDDDACASAKIYYGSQSIDLTKKRGTITIENVDLVKYEYKLTLQLLYFAYSDNIFPEEIKSELMTEKIVIEPEQPKKGCGKSSALLFTSLTTLSLAVLVIRKKK